MRLLVWNIRAGGGRRVESILAEVRLVNPDVCVFSEFRGTPPSQWLAKALKQIGFEYQRKAEGPDVLNTVFLASKYPLRKIGINCAPEEPGRWLSVRTQAVNLGLVHIPNEVTKRKDSYLQSVLDVAARWGKQDALILGDTNSGRPHLDEENPVFDERYTAWFDALERLKWADAFRHLHGDAREFTWYSPNKGNGFRLDQVFMSPSMTKRIRHFEHRWAGAGARKEKSTAKEIQKGKTRRDAVSDHAAMVVEFEP